MLTQKEPKTMRKSLTPFAVKNLKPRPGGRYEVPDTSPGLRLCVHPTGKKMWLLRFRRPNSGKNAKLTLGHWYEGEMAGEPVLGGPLTIAAARELAARLLRDKATGRDPAADRKAEKLARRLAANTPAADTGGEAIMAYVKDHCLVRQRRPLQHASLLGIRIEKPRRRRNSTLNSEHPKLVIRPGGLAATWAHRPLASIMPPEITAIVQQARTRPLAGRRVSVKGESPSRALALFHALSRFFAWCVETHRLERSPVTMRAPHFAADRNRVLSPEEIRALWTCCEEWEGTGISPWHAAAIKLLLITGQRRQEITELTWEEIEGGELVLGPSRTKNKRQHVLPLPKMVLTILESVPRVAGSPYVFSADGVRPIGNWSRAKKALDAAMAVRLGLGRGSEVIRLAPERLKPWRIHDLRRTMSTNLARIGVAIHVNERCLNHVSGSLGGLVGIYQRYSYRQEILDALERWAEELTRMTAVQVTTASGE
jgi:integrase